MKISELLIPELKHETQLVEKFLKRVPQDKLDWKPHEKSMSMGKLCAHLVEIYDWIPGTMNVDEMDMAGYKSPTATSIDELISKLPEVAKVAETALDKDDDEYWRDWAMKQDGAVLMQMPKYTVLRSMVLNQFPHHRAQLGVYFRMLDISVPSTYGPSADES